MLPVHDDPSVVSESDSSKRPTPCTKSLPDMVVRQPVCRSTHDKITVSPNGGTNMRMKELSLEGEYSGWTHT